MVNPGVNIIARGGKRSCSNSAENEDPTIRESCNKSSSQQPNLSAVAPQQGLSSKLEEVKQAIRRESSRFKGEMEVRILLSSSSLAILRYADGRPAGGRQGSHAGCAAREGL